MTLQVRVVGPGVDVVRRLEPGAPALIIGRDTECAICLPDPERNVSRRHLSVWNDGGQLQFHVLSVVNGVQTPAGALPPGARGVLAPGETMALASFRITAAPAEDAEPVPPAFVDTWARLQDDAERLPGDGATTPFTPPEQEEDPFGEWGFQSSFGPGEPAGLPAEAPVPAADLQAFLAGLGLGASAPARFTQGELEMIGRVTRIALQGLLQASEAAARGRRERGGADAGAGRSREPDPLRLEAPLEVKLDYLFGGAAAAAGLLPPDRAVAQLAGELAAHEEAMALALPEAIRGVLADFEPEALKRRLLGDGSRLFESARAWKAFSRDYAARIAEEPAWVRQLLDRHFAEAYARALLRGKRNTGGPTDG